MADAEDPRLRALQKVRGQWKQIIDKYSRLGEDEQGDVLDLKTGKIIEDSGHLRSMKDSTREKDNVWKSLSLAEKAENLEAAEEAEGPEERQRRLARNARRRERRRELKEQREAHATSETTEVIESIPILSDSEEEREEEYYDELLLEYPDYFNSMRHESKMTTRSKVSRRDNLTVSRRTGTFKVRSSNDSQVSRSASPMTFAQSGLKRDPLIFKPPHYDRNKTYEENGLYKSRPGNYSGPLLTPSKLKRMKSALEKSAHTQGNDRLKRLVWRWVVDHPNGRREGSSSQGGVKV